jgi:Holliday junction resolvasome RuvABC endonuclease subunit
MIISVDMGLSNYGFTLWEKDKLLSVHLIQTKKEKNVTVSKDMIRRHKIIVFALCKVFNRCNITGLVGEMPGFGSQSCSAAVAMTMASTITLTLCNAYKIPMLWHTPRTIKKYFTGNPNASKKDMMKEACFRHNWKITQKRIKDSKKLIGYRHDSTYHVMGKKYSMGKFEHIADSIAAYYTAKNK